MTDYAENLPGITKTTRGISGHRPADEFLPLRIEPHPDQPNMSQARPGDVVRLDYDGWSMHFRVEGVEPGPVLVCWPLVMDGEDHALIRERLVDMVTGVRRNPEHDKRPHRQPEG